MKTVTEVMDILRNAVYESGGTKEEQLELLQEVSAEIEIEIGIA